MMNRRDFVKALVGLPLLGVVAKLPKTEESLSPDLLQEALADMADASKQVGSGLRELAAASQAIEESLADAEELYWSPWREADPEPYLPNDFDGDYGYWGGKEPRRPPRLNDPSSWIHCELGKE